MTSPARARLRLAEPADAAEIAAIYEAFVTDTAISFELVAPDVAEMRRRIESVLAYAPWLVCEKGGEILGYAYASRHHVRAAYQWSIDAGIYIRGDSHRHGLGRALYGSLFELARLHGFCAVHAGITLPNAASVGLHESLGFRLVGVYPSVGYKFDAWRDVGWWQLSLRDRLGPPPPILTPERAQMLPEWSAALESGLPLLRL